MTGLVLRNPGLRGLFKPLMLSILTATFFGNLMAFSAAGREGPVIDAPWLNLASQLALVLPAVFVLYLGRAGCRARQTELGLPLAAAVLWRAHFLALMLAVGGLVLAAAAALVGLGHLLTDMMDRAQPGLLTGLQLVVRPGAVCLFVMALAASWRPSLAQPERASGWSKLRMALTATALLTTAILTWLPAVAALVPLTIGAVVASRAHGNLGPALDLAADPAVAGPGTGAGEDPTAWQSVPESHRALHALIVHTVLKCPSYLVFMSLLLVVIGVALSGFFTVNSDNDALRLTNYFLIVYILFSPAGVFINSLHKLDHLPISRRTLLAWLILPVVSSLVIGYGLGKVGLLFKEGRGETLVFVNDEENYGLKLPPSYFRPVWGQMNTAVTAPWGETRELETWQVLPGLPLHLVKPFTTPELASRDFVAWQVSRAAQSVYGVKIPADEIADRYLRTDGAGRTLVVDDGLTLQRDYPDLTPVANGPIFVVLIGCHLVGLGLITWAFFAVLAHESLRRRAKMVFIGFMSVLMVAHVGVGVGLITRTHNEDIVYGLLLGRIRALGELGAGSWLVAGGVFALILYLVASGVARAFARLESPRTGRLNAN